MLAERGSEQKQQQLSQKETADKEHASSVYAS